jgi:CheY-like chemotaxis protein
MRGSVLGSVLIVHEDAGVRLSLAELLAARSYEVLCVSGSSEALAVLEEDVPSLLVIGVGLPLMSGWKLVEALAHYPDLSCIPRLLVSPGDAQDVIGARVLALLDPAKPATAEADVDPVAARPAARTANA